jgi:isopenicillin-N N-acyltransferase-like protein
VGVTTALAWPGTELGVHTHRSPPSSPYERGHALGAAQAEAVASTLAFYGRLLQDDFGLTAGELALAGRQVRATLTRLGHAAMVAEIEGIADGAACERDVLLALNARTELIAGGRYAAAAGGPACYRGPRLPAECSVIGVAPERGAEQHGLLAQNWDYHPDLLGARLLWLIERPDGGWLCTFTEAGLLGKCGLNSDGVAVTLNYLAAADDGGLDGMPIHLLARAALEHGRDGERALATLAGTPVSASSALTVAGAGVLATVEVTPQGARIVAAEDGLLLHTNHFLRADGVTDLMLGPDGGPDTVTRLGELERTLVPAGRLGVDDVAGTLASHAHAPDAICTHRDEAGRPWIERIGTLASLVMDVTARRLWLAAGHPCSAPLQPVPLPAA